MLGESALVAVVIVAFLLFFLWRRFAPSEGEHRTVEDTEEPAFEWEEVTATITFADGTEETIEYDNRYKKDEQLTVFETYDTDCFEVGRSVRGNTGRPTTERHIPEENRRYINMSNVRDIDIERTEMLVAFTEVEVERKEYLYKDVWRTEQYKFKTLDEDYDFSIWPKFEYEARNS